MRYCPNCLYEESDLVTEPCSGTDLVDHKGILAATQHACCVGNVIKFYTFFHVSKKGIKSLWLGMKMSHFLFNIIRTKDW